MEDPGNEIGPESPGSHNMGLWFHDPPKHSEANCSGDLAR
jgi:hypothetical protein